MASTQVNPTRMELTKQKKKLVTAVRGHKLLKDKRDELMRQFLDLVRENMELRKKVEAGIRSANTNFVIAKAGMSEETLNTALMAPKQEVYLETGKKNVMSVDIPVFEYKTRTPDANDIYSYGFAFTSSDLDGAVKSLADILPDMLRLAEVEKAAELAKQSGEALQGIVTKVEESADQVSAIATASEQQSATSDEINQSIVSVNEMSSQTAQAMGEASRAVSELARQAERMSELISEMKRG